jgi:glutamate formiminotransferase
VGARPFLIAFNVYLNTGDVEIAKKIAKTLRFSSGGLRFVQAMGVLVEGQAQVSMNLTDFRQTAMPTALEMVRREGARYGAAGDAQRAGGHVATAGAGGRGLLVSAVGRLPRLTRCWRTV